MKLVRHSARVQRDDHLIPLINVIFLMLIFFMIVGQITPSEPLRVQPPLSEQKASGEGRERIIILASDGRLAIGDQVLSPQALPERLAAWQRAAKPSHPTQVTIKADAAVTAGRLRETLDLLEAAGIPRVELITRAADRS